jgi:hypothetical protein
MIQKLEELIGVTGEINIGKNKEAYKEEHVTGIISHGGPTHMGLGPRGIVKYAGGPRSWQHVSGPEPRKQEIQVLTPHWLPLNFTLKKYSLLYNSLSLYSTVHL